MKGRLWLRWVLGLLLLASMGGLWRVTPVAGKALHWTAPVNLSQSDTDSARPAVALLGGRLHVVWEENGQLYHRYQVDSGWSDPVRIGTGSEPALAPGPDGKLHLAYVDLFNDNAEIFYRSWSSEGWSAGVNVSSTRGASATPDIAIRGDGRRFIVWVEDALTDPWVFYAESGDGLVWENNPVPDAFGTSPRLAIDAAGRLHVIWTEPYGSGEPLELFYIQWTGDEWTFPEVISNTPSRASLYGALALDPMGTPWAAWQEDVDGVFQIWTSARRGGRWTRPTALAEPGQSLTEPALATGDRLGEAWVAGTRLRARWLEEDVWRPPETAWQASNAIRQPALAVGAGGEMWIAWVGRGPKGADDVFVSHRRAGTLKRLYLPLQIRRG